MKFAENYKVVPVMTYADISSTVVADSINMRDYRRCTFLFMIHAASAASATLTVASGATDGTADSGLAFDYAIGGAAIGTATAGSTTSCDVLAAKATAEITGIVLTYGTYANKMLIVEVGAEKMDVDNEEEWLTATITTTTSVAGRVSCFAILEPRYQKVRSPTALAV